MRGRIRSIGAVGPSSYEVYFEFEGAGSCAYTFEVDDHDGIAVVVRPGNFLDAVDPGSIASRPFMEAILKFHEARLTELEFRQVD